MPPALALSAAPGILPPRVGASARQGLVPLALIAAAFLLRVGTFGDPNLHDDELFYLYIGQRLHDGALPYVDIWDRKPPGLFLLYALFACLSRSVVTYQLAAALSAGLTAGILVRLARRLGLESWRAAIPGLLYLSALPLLGGCGGQVAVFMNLLTALSAELALAAGPRLRTGALPHRALAAMACIGLALTLKQTSLCEGAFIAAWMLRQLSATAAGRRNLARAGTAFAALAIAPMLAWAARFAFLGHFTEFWHAMVIANLDKAYNPSHDLTVRWLALAVLLAPLGILAVVAALVRRQPGDSLATGFCATWLAASLAGAAVVPNLLDHYALPVLVPLAALTARTFRAGRLAPALGLLVASGFLAETHAFDLTRASRSAAAMDELVSEIRARDPHPSPLVYDGPVYLYALLDTPPPSPLALPFHLNYAPERNTSPYDTASETRRILATRPSLVITQLRSGSNNLLNRETQGLVSAYIARQCRWQFTRRLLNAEGSAHIIVHGGCRHPFG